MKVTIDTITYAVQRGLVFNDVAIPFVGKRTRELLTIHREFIDKALNSDATTMSIANALLTYNAHTECKEVKLLTDAFQLPKIKLVVFNEHTLGYIFPEYPTRVHHLMAMVTKGATFTVSGTSDCIDSTDTIRLANEKDFNEYRVSFEGYKQDTETYEYEK